MWTGVKPKQSHQESKVNNFSLFLPLSLSILVSLSSFASFLSLSDPEPWHLGPSIASFLKERDRYIDRQRERERKRDTSCVLVKVKSSPETTASPSLSLLTTQKQMCLGKGYAKSQRPWRVKTNHMTELPLATNTELICCLIAAYSWMPLSPFPSTPSRVNNK